MSGRASQRGRSLRSADGDPYRAHATGEEADRPSCRFGEIEAPAGDVRPSIDDGHVDAGSAMLLQADAYERAAGKRLVGDPKRGAGQVTTSAGERAPRVGRPIPGCAGFLSRRAVQPFSLPSFLMLQPELTGAPVTAMTPAPRRVRLGSGRNSERHKRCQDRETVEVDAKATSYPGREGRWPTPVAQSSGLPLRERASVGTLGIRPLGNVPVYAGVAFNGLLAHATAASSALDI